MSGKGLNVKQARETMAAAFKKDPHFRDTYVANVAMLLWGRHRRITRKNCNEAADEVIHLIFESTG